MENKRFQRELFNRGFNTDFIVVSFNSSLQIKHLMLTQRLFYVYSFSYKNGRLEVSCAKESVERISEHKRMDIAWSI